MDSGFKMSFFSIKVFINLLKNGINSNLLPQAANGKMAPEFTEDTDEGQYGNASM